MLSTFWITLSIRSISSSVSLFGSLGWVALVLIKFATSVVIVPVVVVVADFPVMIREPVVVSPVTSSRVFVC